MLARKKRIMMMLALRILDDDGGIDRIFKWFRIGKILQHYAEAIIGVWWPIWSRQYFYQNRIVRFTLRKTTQEIEQKTKDRYLPYWEIP